MWLALVPWSLLANFLLVPVLVGASVPFVVIVILTSTRTVSAVVWITLPLVHRLLRPLRL